MSKLLEPSASRLPSMLQTADRALLVLQLFTAPRETLTVTEIARRLGLNRSTASRLVATLEYRGFLERSAPGEGLRLGREIGRLGRLTSAGADLVEIADAVLERLADETGETVTLAVPAADAVRTLAQADGRHFVTSGNWAGLVMAPHCSSDGKVLLAFGALTLTDGELPVYAPRTVTDREALLRELERVREDGFATANGEMEDGLAGMSVPVLDGGACVAALCVSGPAYRLDDATLRGFVGAARRAAAIMEQRLAEEAAKAGEAYATA